MKWIGVGGRGPAGDADLVGVRHPADEHVGVCLHPHTPGKAPGQAPDRGPNRCAPAPPNPVSCREADYPGVKHPQ